MRGVLAAALLLALSLPGCGVSPREPGSDDFAAARARMVREQLEARGIRDRRVLEAMGRVPRHELVPESLRARAYDDGPLPIGEGQTISQPLVVATMSQALALQGDERVLEVGTGSGYQAAVLAELAAEVYTIELEPALAARAARDLERLGYGAKLHTRLGDGYAGWPEAAPFDAIVVTAAPDHVPQPLVEQLVAGGRLVIPVGGRGGQQLLLLTRTESGVVREELLPVMFVPLRRDPDE